MRLESELARTVSAVVSTPRVAIPLLVAAIALACFVWMLVSAVESW